MSDICPTVKIKRGDGYCVINESDFDSAKHEPWIEPPPVPALPPLPPAPVAPADPLASLAADWRHGDVGRLRQLAATVSGRTVENKKQAIDVIEAELAKRKV